MSYRWLEMNVSGPVYEGDKILLKSTSPFTADLPSVPTVGRMVSFIDAVGQCETNNTTINRNGKKIMGLNENLTINSNGASFDLVYQGSTRGWVIR